MSENIRPYEVSIWTLQDGFISVLKPSNLEKKDLTQDAVMTLKDDGENNLSLKIPMYIYRNGNYMENPIWYNTINGNLIADMRKLKVIFNKNQANEKVFEFIITKVTESHEGFEKYCEIECESLAFHELGKQGYQIVLSADEYVADVEEIDKAIKEGTATEVDKPKATINYWCDKVFKNSVWRYSICMNWTAFDGIADKTMEEYMQMNASARESYNAQREARGLRRCDKIYRDPYVADWSIMSDGSVIPSRMVEQEEMETMVDGSESNRYNLTQAIAEAFRVFCKYIYYYDDNYHIIDREVIFYNNFLQESNGMIDITYKYNTSKLSREMDGTDLVSKMFIKPLTDTGLLNGTTSIMDTPANKSLEDYLLNFDYMYNIGTITKEQYDEAKVYEEKLRALNLQIIPIQEQINLDERSLSALQAKKQTAEDAITYDQEQANINAAKQQVVDDASERPVENPKHVFLLLNNDTNRYYFNAPDSGIDVNTLRIYLKWQQTNEGYVLSDEIQSSNYHIIRDPETGDISRISFSSHVSSILKNPEEQTYSVYLTYNYNPKTYYQKIIDMYNKRERADQATADAMADEISVIEERIRNNNNKLKNKTDNTGLIVEKQKIINAFERLLGPALREGTWQPEDEYAQYTERHNENFTISSNNSTMLDKTSNAPICMLGWDDEPFKDEQLNYYYSDVNMTKTYYPCVNLTNYMHLFAAEWEKDGNEDKLIKSDSFLKRGTFIYTFANLDDMNDPNALQSLGFGSKAKFAYIQHNVTGIIYPVLMITGVETIPDIYDDEAGRIKTAAELIKKNARLGIRGQQTVGGTVEVDTRLTINDSDWISNPSDYHIVFPRFQINSKLFLAQDSSLNMIRVDANNIIKTLVPYYEYTGEALYRNDKYYITLTPEAMFGGGSNEYNILFTYAISKAALAVYLDAIQVLKENSIPKVSYSVESQMNNDFINDAYNRIGQLVHINDEELKFQNVRGYISEIELDLDRPWEDKITVKNYKTKFEDLFSTIVAETEQMRKNSGLIGLTAGLFTNTNDLNPNWIGNYLNGTNLIDQMITRNATIVANELAIAAAANKALLAESVAYRVMNGELGLAFPDSDVIDTILLNNEWGFVLQGYSQVEDTNNGQKLTYPSFFRVTNGAMGFFAGHYDRLKEETVEYGTTEAQHQAFINKYGFEPKALLYFQGGDLALSGNIYARHGWFGGNRGWIIGAGDTGGYIHYSGEGEASADYETKLNELITTFDVNGFTDATLDSGRQTTVGGGVVTLRRDLGGLFYAANGKIIMATGTDDDDSSPLMAFYRKSFGKEPILVFENGNLTISGRMTAANFYQSSNGSWLPLDEYVQEEPNIRTHLKELLDKAAEILIEAQYVREDLSQDIIKNNDILAGFAEAIGENMNPQVFRQGTAPTTFKVGDVWIDTSNSQYEMRYVATMNSKDKPAGAAAKAGWTITHDGSLAGITGANIDINSELGTIELAAKTQISLKSGGNIYIAADTNVDIVGNKEVNIGGGKVNIVSDGKGGYGGVHIAETNWETPDSNGSSYVDLDRNGIEMKTSGGIKMAGAGGIEIKTSSGTPDDASVISLNQERGIWVGSGKEIVLFSGDGVPNSKTGAEVSLSREKLLFGVSSNNITSATEVTKDYIILTTGSIDSSSDGTTSSGLKMTRNEISLVTGTTSSASIIDMTDGKISIGTVAQVRSKDLTDGAYIEITKNRLLIAGAYDASTQTVSAGNHASLEVYMPNIVIDGAGNLTVRGTVKANAGWFGGENGWIVKNNFLYSASLGTDFNNWTGSNLSRGGIVLFSGYDGSIPYSEINMIGRKSPSGSTVFRLWSRPSLGTAYNNDVNNELLSLGDVFRSGNGQRLAYTADGRLIVSGEITATSLYIGSDTIKNYVDNEAGIITAEQIKSYDATLISNMKTFARFVVDDSAGTAYLVTNDNATRTFNYFIFDNNGISIKSNKNLSLEGGNINLTSSGSISLSSGNISLSGGSISLTGSGGISLNGGSISLTSTGGIKMETGQLTLNVKSDSLIQTGYAAGNNEDSSTENYKPTQHFFYVEESTGLVFLGQYTNKIGNQSSGFLKKTHPTDKTYYNITAEAKDMLMFRASNMGFYYHWFRMGGSANAYSYTSISVGKYGFINLWHADYDYMRINAQRMLIYGSSEMILYGDNIYAYTNGERWRLEKITIGDKTFMAFSA